MIKILVNTSEQPGSAIEGKKERMLKGPTLVILFLFAISSHRQTGANFVQQAVNGLKEIVDFVSPTNENGKIKAEAGGQPAQQPSQNQAKSKAWSDNAGPDSSQCGRDQNGKIEQDYYSEGVEFFQKQQWKEAYERFNMVWNLFNQLNQQNLQHCLSVGDPIDVPMMIQQTALLMGNFDEVRGIGDYIMRYPALSDDRRARVYAAYVEAERQTTQKVMNEAMQDLATDDSQRHVSAVDKILSLDVYRECNEEYAKKSAEHFSSKPFAVCRLTNRNRHPLLVLKPVKEEILFPEPFVAFFHDVLTEKEVETFKSKAEAKLDDSKVHGEQEHIEVNTRKSKTAWLTSDTFPELTNYLGAVVGLDLFEPATEAYQIARYTKAGHYLPHLDTKTHVEPEGDRLATM